jgi:hypothetical protein
MSKKNNEYEAFRDPPTAYKKEDRHPVQPVVVDAHGVHRFKKNPIVDYLLEFYSEKTDDGKSGGGLNLLREESENRGFKGADWEQFAQLIGYSVSGSSDLSYMSDKTWAKASKRSRKLRKEKSE